MIKDQTDSQFRQQAKELAAPIVEMLARIAEKYSQSILEQMHAELKARDQRIQNLKNAIGLAVSCLQVELGELAVKHLVAALDKVDEPFLTPGETKK